MGNNSINERNYENARRNSVGYDKKTKYTKYVKIPVAHIKNAAMATLLAASIIAGGHLVPKLVETININAIVYEETQKGRDLVFENTHRTDDKQHYFYDTYSIAQGLVAEPENFDKNILGIHDTIGYNKNNKIEQMDKIFGHISVMLKDEQNSKIKDYKSLEGYCLAKGIVDKDGNADFNALREKLSEQIAMEYQIEKMENKIEKMQEEISEFKKR